MVCDTPGGVGGAVQAGFLSVRNPSSTRHTLWFFQERSVSDLPFSMLATKIPLSWKLKFFRILQYPKILFFRFGMPWGPENCYGLMVLCVESMEIQLAKKVGIFPSDFFSFIFRGMPCAWFRPKISMPLRRRYWQMLLLPRAQGNVEKWQSQDGKMRKDEEGDEIVKPSEIWRWRNMEKPHEVVHSPFWTSSIVFF